MDTHLFVFGTFQNDLIAVVVLFRYDFCLSLHRLRLPIVVVEKEQKFGDSDFNGYLAIENKAQWGCVGVIFSLLLH
jgi:hypothetical protein